MLERGGKLPSWIEDEPEYFPGDVFYLKAFWELSTERQIGFAPGPIPGSAIQEYARQKGLESYMMDMFTAVIRGLDTTYLKEAEEARKKAAKKKE